MPANEPVGQSPPPTAGAKPSNSSRHLDIALFVLVTVVIAVVLAMLATNIVSQHVNYKSGIASALSDKASVDHSAVITYSRAWDFAIIKTSSFFLSVLVILVGSLYVLRVSRHDIDVSVNTGIFRGAFSTTSPGLAMILLGVVLAVFALNDSSEIRYEGRENTQVRQIDTKPKAPNVRTTDKQWRHSS